jgi:adenosylhomocysteine nucleosidase
MKRKGNSVWRRLVLSAALLVALGRGSRADNIAFFYALDADFQALKQHARDCRHAVSIGARKIQRLLLGPHTIYVIKMGSGCVETAASAQALLARFPCDWAFAVGPAGALSDDVQVGRWYRAGNVIAWQRERQNEGDPVGVPNTFQLDWEKFPIAETSFVWQCEGTVTVASGEAFIASRDERARLNAVFGAEIVDMNSYGLAAVCRDHGVPLFAWKIISDRADDEAMGTFREFLAAYTGEGGHRIADLLEALPPHPDSPLTYPAIRTLLEQEDR